MTLSSAARFLDRINQSARAACIARSVIVVSRHVSQLITISPLVAQREEKERERERERERESSVSRINHADQGVERKRRRKDLQSAVCGGFAILSDSREETRVHRLAFTDTFRGNYRLT
jgi:hypothetical protein